MDRLRVTYQIQAQNNDEAQERANNIALEQTVEIPRDVVPKGFIEDEILGKVESCSQTHESHFDAIVSYSAKSVGTELTQLFNVIFGNSSIQQGLQVTNVDLGSVLGKQFPGARFGTKGVRERAACSTGGLISPVLKPQGSNTNELAEIAYLCALAGANIVKEDHGLVNQPAAPFKKRVEEIAKAVNRANKETGHNCLYFPNIGGHFTSVIEDAQFAKQAGAGGILLMPGLLGFDIVNHFSSDADFDLPIMTHPSFLGPYVLSNDTGFTHSMMFGVLQRLAGSDISVFPNVGGRFGFSSAQCQSIASACCSTKGIGKPIFPSPGGGMSKDRAGEMRRMYGDDVVYLLGGSLLRYGDKIGEGIKEMRTALAAR
ncbi:RuBisCO large subunit C-terminal-like domain-containing protein [Maritalea porphyrae]|uniref:RuBisCO large subunit C-terminal-like domain-containing protein n=1 Tax=Maritalea porphyrae TaxID=880732 RepID=UPI0022AF918A|nr:RuBisCO large subunit C-terminal-like domain-containing protein [Maritalea porphyrae]MCZ4274176.1 RuBisCO large subunit C-terminal-like domain-containing protein [Maritalea porphyrae]